MADKLKNSQNRVKLWICLFVRLSFTILLGFCQDLNAWPPSLKAHTLAQRQLGWLHYNKPFIELLFFRNMHSFWVICPLLKPCVVWIIYLSSSATTFNGCFRKSQFLWTSLFIIHNTVTYSEQCINYVYL